MLYEILDRARGTQAALANSSYAEVWAEVWDVPPDAPELGRKLSLLLVLADEVRGSVLGLPDMDEEATTPMQLVEKASLRDPSGPWSHYWGAINGDTTMQLLKVAAGFIDAARQPAEAFVLVDAQTLRRHLSTLLEDVLASEIAADLKRTIVQHLRKIVKTLQDEELTPCTETRTRLEALAARVLFWSDVIDQLSRSEIGKRVLALVGSVVVALGLSTSGLMPGLPDPDPVVERCVNPKPAHALPSVTEPKALPPATDAPEDQAPTDGAH